MLLEELMYEWIDQWILFQEFAAAREKRAMGIGTKKLIT